MCLRGQARAPEVGYRAGLQDCRMLAEDAAPLGAHFSTAGADAAVRTVQRSFPRPMSPLGTLLGGGHRAGRG